MVLLPPIELADMPTQRSGTSPIDYEDLPAIFRTRDHDLVAPSSRYTEFLDNDLSVERVENVLPYLWLVGRPYPARALNIQKVLRREIVPTTDASLHLIWTSQKIYVKALPRYITAISFYYQHLTPSHPHAPALGLLFSYIALVPTELDFEIACESHLFHKGYTWEEWRTLTRRFLDDYSDDTVYEKISKRYIHGELRLSRLDKVYRYRYGNLLHGYSTLLGNTRYVDFFAENLKLVTATTVYTALVLTAMQVGLGVDALKDNKSFQRASYGFTVFAILSPIVAVGFVIAVAAFMFLGNWVNTKKTQRRRFKNLGLAQFSTPTRKKHLNDETAP